MRWKVFPVLDDGHVCLVDWMGDDLAICDAARISFGAGTRSVSDDRTLIRYLMRCRHTSPFEQCELKLRVRVPMDCWRQWIRHRTANVNEYSTRYSEAVDSQQKTRPDQWRLQSPANKQGSGGFITEFPPGTKAADYSPDGSATPGDFLSWAEAGLHEQSRLVYQQRLKLGVAREQARKDLPLSTYTEAYWKIDLHNLFHFLSLRMDLHAQAEIRSYADTIGHEIVAPMFPLAWEAFCDYRLGAVTLSRLDLIALRQCLTSDSGSRPDHTAVAKGVFSNARERDEFIAKARLLGIE